ncbi:hypothetical protein SERLA73DRAFT_190053 [Serpula lacrymans var. lacrymans S7.3]|uniref:Uncharacterized protein n=2 Tax=Serpula lacrymans var. lacrymans TaxID=341189 RepID=F8QF05_SERL3|nr:uncharacterized protein SERLADRAFT_376637 [Serpula lacrymans var. lacrymans S7.9]EGN93168.1 hypothetical protein SERLA73DRAFT_190053 [Serpula lacrymans var. lacrymans S7.3]EGO31065.1 hypothetical protein SERLADRAFT_376637 [Serpula lacrymans var. lacrymans S7.9]
MWIAHFAPGLAAKPLAPSVPLSLLALAGAIPDAAFFVLSFLHLESFRVDPNLMKRGCFPYATDYPISHSLVGMAVIGAAFTAGYTMMTQRRVSIQDQLVLMAVTLSHFILEVPSHRPDIKIKPTDPDSANLGSGMFDHPVALFIVESFLFLLGLSMYATFSPLATRAGYKKEGRMYRLWGVVVFMLVQQAHFCFGAAPTTNTTWVHGPTFLSEILLSSWLLGKLES